MQIEDLLEKIHNAFDNRIGKLLKSFDYETIVSTEKTSDDNYTTKTSVQFSNIIYADRPTYFSGANIRYANNDWQNNRFVEVKEDQGIDSPFPSSIASGEIFSDRVGVRTIGFRRLFSARLRNDTICQYFDFILNNSANYIQDIDPETKFSDPPSPVIMFRVLWLYLLLFSTSSPSIKVRISSKKSSVSLPN